MPDYKIIDKCLLCNGNIDLVISFGYTPLANEFVNDKNIKQDLFPLNLMKCNDCNNFQIDCIINKEKLYTNYFYVSGTSKVNVKHFKDYANNIINRFNLKSSDTIYEIASNDGIFLSNFKEQNINIIGIDPAKNIAKEANKNGIFTIPKFFNEKLAKQLIKKYGKAKVIACNNCFAHNENLYTIIKGVLELLTDDGIFVFENSYLLDILENNIFDLVYHEHIFHHSLTPLIKFFKQYNLDIFDVERHSNHGGSIRVFVCKSGVKEINKNVDILLEAEKQIPLKIETFKQKINIIKNKLNNKLKEIKNNNKTIAIYGLPAKSTTLLYYFNINEKIIDFAVDDAKLKQNTYSPGKHIPIYYPNDIYIKKPDYILILGWNFSQSIIENHKNFNGKWIIPLPEYKEI